MPKYFDIHSHLNFKDYDACREDVIQRLKETETHTICIGTNLESSRNAVALAEKHDEIYACIGVHPVDNPNQIFEREKFEELVQHPRVVAVGECGLDFFHADKNVDYERQRKLFVDQIEFALKYDKPLMIHARNAYEELIELLESITWTRRVQVRGNVHFFAGDRAIAQKLFGLGFSVSFTGVITFARDYDEVIKSVPLDMIMSETDSPYVAPVPYRGQRNEPSYVSEVAKKIANIRGEDEEVVKAALVNNAFSMIG